ncbi:tetratricopeptide repeat (TPR)-like superfamily protein isoform X2 [Wolffia australiana]
MYVPTIWPTPHQTRGCLRRLARRSFDSENIKMFFRQAFIYLKRSTFLHPVFTMGIHKNNVSTYLCTHGSSTSSYQVKVSLYAWRRIYNHISWQALFAGQAGLIIGLSLSSAAAEDTTVNGVSSESATEDTVTASVYGLQKIEDGSIISNSHTVKWRLFTDKGRSLFLEGKIEEAEKCFLSALEEAKEGFGKRDPHVASSLNNLAEVYRVRKTLSRAEPLYLEAIRILEEAFGEVDVRVGVALHNLGQFYLVQKNLDEARRCYEIKERVLGFEHTEYADTMYHLGTVLYLQGKEKDGEVLVQDSIRILEDGGLGQSGAYVRRMRHLSQMFLKSGRLHDVEGIQRKILHLLEILKGWTLETVIAAEQLALTLQALGNLLEAEELFERCLNARKNILPEEHIQVASNMLHLARTKILQFGQLMKNNLSEARVALENADILLEGAKRISRAKLDPLIEQRNIVNIRTPDDAEKNYRMALMILIQSLSAMGLIELSKLQIQKEMMQPLLNAASKSEHVLRECIAIYREKELWSLLKYQDVKEEYLSCLRRLISVLEECSSARRDQHGMTLKELMEEVKRIENDILDRRNLTTSLEVP